MKNSLVGQQGLALAVGIACTLVILADELFGVGGVTMDHYCRNCFALFA